MRQRDQLCGEGEILYILCALDAQELVREYVFLGRAVVKGCGLVAQGVGQYNSWLLEGCQEAERTMKKVEKDAKERFGDSLDVD